MFSVDNSVFSVDKVSRLKDSNIQLIKSSQYPVLLLSTLTQQRKPLLDLLLLEVKVMSRVKAAVLVRGTMTQAPGLTAPSCRVPFTASVSPRSRLKVSQLSQTLDCAGTARLQLQLALLGYFRGYLGPDM